MRVNIKRLSVVESIERIAVGAGATGLECVGGAGERGERPIRQAARASYTMVGHFWRGFSVLFAKNKAPSVDY
jgi:hypothetical protein